MTQDNAMAPDSPLAAPAGPPQAGSAASAGPPPAAPAAQAAPAAPAPAKQKRAYRKKAETAAEARSEPVKRTVRVIAAKVRKHHPYQKVDITTAFPVELPMDNWLEVQISAGVLKQVD